MEGKVVWRADLKPVGKEELEKALAYKWAREIRVNPKNYERISEIMPAKTQVVLVANAGVSLCEFQVLDGIPIPRIDWGEMPKGFQRDRVKEAKDKISVVFIRAMLEKGASEKEIRAFFAETQQVISLSQIRAIQEGKSKRAYISLKKKDKSSKRVKETNGRKRRVAEEKIPELKNKIRKNSLNTKKTRK